MRGGESERDASEREDGPSDVQCYFKDRPGHVSFGIRIMANSKNAILGTSLPSWAPSSQGSMSEYYVRRTGELYGERSKQRKVKG